MKNSVIQPFRLLVALVAGVLCLAVAAYPFNMPQWNTPLVRFAIAAFGLAWFAQAYVIRDQIRGSRG